MVRDPQESTNEGASETGGTVEEEISQQKVEEQHGKGRGKGRGQK